MVTRIRKAVEINIADANGKTVRMNADERTEVVVTDVREISSGEIKFRKRKATTGTLIAPAHDVPHIDWFFVVDGGSTVWVDLAVTYDYVSAYEPRKSITVARKPPAVATEETETAYRTYVAGSPEYMAIWEHIRAEEAKAVRPTSTI